MVVFAESLSEGDNRAIGRDFIVLDALSCPNERCIEDRAFQTFLHDFRTFFHQPFHACALLAFSTVPERLEDLLDPCHVSFGLFQVFSKPCAAIRPRSGLGELRKGFHQLIFRVVNIL